MAKLSIVTLTFNNFTELEATFHSLEKINNLDFEWVVIDGGSCLKTERFMHKQSSVNQRYLKESDDGIYDAFNKGVKNSIGDYIVFLNSGDLLTDLDYFKEAIDFLDNSTDLKFCHSNIIFKDNLAGDIELKHKKRPLGAGMPFFHQTLIVHRSVFNKIGLFDTSFRIAGDYDWVVRMLSHNIEGIHIKRPTVLMDGVGVSSTNESKSIKECYISLKRNRALSFSNSLGIAKRFLSFKMRKMLILLGLWKLVVLIKKLKN